MEEVMNEKDLKTLLKIQKKLNGFYKKHPKHRGELMEPLANLSRLIASSIYIEGLLD